MERKLSLRIRGDFSVPERAVMLASLSALWVACGVGTTVAPTAAPSAPPPVIELTVEATEPPAGISANVASNPQADYCFAYPESFTQSGSAEHLTVVGPFPAGGPEPGLGWVDVGDPQGKTAQEVADAEANALGLNPERSTIKLGGEEALKMDGMSGQDVTRKVYIVHGGKLYTLTFSPLKSDNASAVAQMETLYASATSSWVWISSGALCPVGNVQTVP